MKLYPMQELLTVHGKPLKDNGEVVTVRAMLGHLLDVAAQDKPLTGEAKMERFKLQMRLYEPWPNECFVLTPAEVTLITSVLDKTPGVTPSIYGQIITMMAKE